MGGELLARGGTAGHGGFGIIVDASRPELSTGERWLIPILPDENDVPLNSTTPAIRELARRLIALETPRDASGSDVFRVCEKLRVRLVKLAGMTGYHFLISRAIAIAKVDAPALGPVKVGLDGSLEGFDEIAENDAEAGVAVLVHLLDLLVTFIGEPVTLGLLRDAWPDASLEKTNLSAEEQS